MALAKGKYIWIAESDDYADPDFLCRTVSALKNNEGAILAFTGSHMVDECGKTLRQDWDHFTAKVPDYSIYEGKAFVQRRMLWSNSVYNASMVVFERKAFEWVSDRYKQFRYCGDWMFWAEICLRGKVIHVNKKLNYFRQHSCKVSPAAEKEGLYFKEGCKVIEYLIDELRLSTFQKCVISGRMRKRLSGAKVEESGFREQILHTHQRLFMGGRLMIVAYQFDKLLTTLMFMQATLFRTLVKVS